MTDNIAKIRELLTKGLMSFDNQNEISMFHIQIIQRRKDQGNSEMTKGERIIKSYFIDNIAHFDQRIDEIKELCNMFNARAYINLNPKTKRQSVRLAARLLFDIAMDDNTDTLNFNGLMDSAVAQINGTKGLKTWIMDIDYKDPDKIKVLLAKLASLNATIIEVIETPNGYHYIVTPFNYNDTKWGDFGCELKKNCPTVMYYHGKE